MKSDRLIRPYRLVRYFFVLIVAAIIADHSYAIGSFLTTGVIKTASLKIILLFAI